MACRNFLRLHICLHQFYIGPYYGTAGYSFCYGSSCHGSYVSDLPLDQSSFVLFCTQKTASGKYFEQDYVQEYMYMHNNFYICLHMDLFNKYLIKNMNGWLLLVLHVFMSSSSNWDLVLCCQAAKSSGWWAESTPTYG